jgi:hypothetical protein
MNRLRHAQEAYYNAEGMSDPIIIFLPNRSVAAGNGGPEKRWIAAKDREGVEEPTAANHLPSQQVNSREGLKRIVPIIAVAASLSILAYISLRLLRMPGQPKLGRLDGSALVIMNAEGKELWRKVFPEGVSTDWFYTRGLGRESGLGILKERAIRAFFLFMPLRGQRRSRRRHRR